jgi:hypothetical protein
MGWRAMDSPGVDGWMAGWLDGWWVEANRLQSDMVGSLMDSESCGGGWGPCGGLGGYKGRTIG